MGLCVSYFNDAWYHRSVRWSIFVRLDSWREPMIELALISVVANVVCYLVRDIEGACK